jgi:hypothetical protein
MAKAVKNYSTGKMTNSRRVSIPETYQEMATCGLRDLSTSSYRTNKQFSAKLHRTTRTRKDQKVTGIQA